MRVGSLERGDNFCFVGGGLLPAFSITPRRRGSADESIEVVLSSARVQENVGNGANIRRRTPYVFISEDGFGEANEFTFLNHDLGYDFRSVSGNAGKSRPDTDTLGLRPAMLSWSPGEVVIRMRQRECPDWFF